MEPAETTDAIDEAGITLTLARPLRGTIDTSGDGYIRTVDAGAESLLGFARSDLIGRHVESVFSPQFHDPVRSGIQQFRNDGQSWLFGQLLSSTVRTADDEEIRVEIEVCPKRSSGERGLQFKNRSGSEWKRQQAHLRFQQALLTAQNAVSSDGMVIVSPAGEILFYNQRYRVIFDLPQDVLDTRLIIAVRKVIQTRIIDPDGTFMQGFLSHAQSEESSVDEVTLVDGRIFERISTPVIAEDGTWFGRSWNYREVTENRRIVHELREQTQRLNALVEDNPDIVASLDRDWNFISINPATVELLGYGLDELTRAGRAHLLLPENEEAFSAHVGSVLQGESQQFDTVARAKDGREIALRVKLIPITLDGQVIGFWVVATDVTESRDAYADLDHFKRNLEASQRMAHLGSFEWDISSDTFTCSDELYRILGIEQGESPLTLKGIFELIHPGDRGNLQTLIEHTVRDHAPYDTLVRIVRPDGQHRVVQAQGEALIGDEGRMVGSTGIALDVTERKREEEALNHFTSLLEERSRKLEMTTREQESFIHSVSHDLRNPIISVHGMAEMLKEDYGAVLDDEGRHYLERIIANASRLHQMLNGLRELSRIGRIEKDTWEEIDLEQLVNNIIEDLQETIERSDAEFVVEGPLPAISGNPSRMAQLFTNLLDNAVKYTPDDRVPHIVVRADPSNSGWDISVEDNGIGIPEDSREKALTMFARLPQGHKLNPSGSGLGLAIVSRIVDVHGGTLRIDSNEGGGTKFSFTLQ